MNMPQLRVIITGCASGIGSEAARQLKQRGAEITGLDVGEPKANVDCYLPVDLSRSASIDRAADALQGPYDALCNIAGLPCRPGLREQVLAVKVQGLRRLTRAVLPKLTPGDSIVNMASRAGQRWRKNIAQVIALLQLSDDPDLAAFCGVNGIDDVRAYDLSKEALIVWTISQTEALVTRGLRMNTISPGAVDTGILSDFLAAFSERATRQIARAGRSASATEVAEVVSFLASRESGWIKGTDSVVDGGKAAFATSDQLGPGHLDMAVL
jgi:NAD(P)-dependent dehydrogenase (short-subunit alcohol dehydrogenase family)